MSLKKLAAGSGYEYLTRQVAAFDSTELGTTPLADYYAAKGESPGLWLGSGLVGINGMEIGDVVTSEQMKHLFGEGRDPVSGAALGRAYGKGSVAGFDLTFSPVKSVSALWAIAAPEVAAVIREAHDAAVGDAIRFLEAHAVFTREGTDGVRQVETRGLIAAAFTHRDSRAGDPDLHTHVAVANKAQTRQGKWLALYGTVLHQHVVAASEAYNTALEHHLRDKLGLRFVDVPRPDGKRSVREVEGVDPALIELWSRRRGDIEDRIAELTAEFTEKHGRPPTGKEVIALAQRANLETRAAKHEPRSEAEQRATWRSQAQRELGAHGIDATVFAATHPTSELIPTSRLVRPTAAWIDTATGRVITELEAHRATWQSWHVLAEVHRQVRDIDIAPEHLPVLAKLLVDEVTARSINLTPEQDPIAEPATLLRSDGTSVYRHTGADHYTSAGILAAEQRIVTAAGHHVAPELEPVEVELAVMGAEATTGFRLNDGQRALVLAMGSDPRQVTLALAPAGSGKTTVTRVLADAWGSLGHEVVGFAPSAAAAAVLHEATGMPTETLAKLDDLIMTGRPVEAIRPGSMVVIDEAGMADTPTLDRAIGYCTQHGALVRLIGDDQQLAAVGAGGVLRDIATTHGAHRLEEVVRFTDPVEAQASLDLRVGDTAALGFYLDHDRIHVADETTSLSEVLTAWQTEQDAGRDCLMLAPTRDLVARLNHAARDARLQGTKPSVEIGLADGNQASAGDVIITRRNDRRFGVSGTDWVKNGDRWTITAVHPDGAVQARHNTSHLAVTLPAGYVAAHVELGYATTVHAAQGQTADVGHGLLTGIEDRQLLYTMLTRGRHENHLHLIRDPAAASSRKDQEQFLPGLDEQLTAIETLDRIIGREGAEVSATTTLTRHTDPATQLRTAVSRYTDALADAALKTAQLGIAESIDGADIIGALEAAGPGPLPWLQGIPARLEADPTWGPYLAARSNRVCNLAERVRQHSQPAAAVDRYAGILPDQLRQQITLWRAATGIPPDERRLLPRTDDWSADRYGRHLQRQVDELHPPQIRRWEDAITQALGETGQDEQRFDEHTLDLARELDRLQRAGLNANQILRRATTLRRPLPEEHRVEALAYRVRQIAASEQQHRPASVDSVRRNQPSRHGPTLGL